MVFLISTIVILFIIVAMLTLRLQINIEELNYKRSTEKDIFTDEEKKNKSLNFLIKTKIYIFNIVPIATFKVDKDRFDKFENRKMVQKMQNKLVEKLRLFGNEIFQNLKRWDKTAVVDIINVAKKLQAKVEKVDLKVEIGFENVFVTTSVVPTLATIISFWFKKCNLQLYENRYEIKPIYSCIDKGKVIDIFFKCFIGIKMIHILRVICIMKKNKKETRTRRIKMMELQL